MVYFALRVVALGAFFHGGNRMQCPFCGETMEKGLIQSGNLLVWVKKKHWLSLLPKDDEVLLDKNYVTGASIPAWICKNCKKVIGEYTELKGEF